MVAFSSSRRKINLINHKDHFCKTLVEVLHEAFPRSVRWAGDDDRNDRCVFGSPYYIGDDHLPMRPLSIRFSIEMNAADSDREYCL